MADQAGKVWHHYTRVKGRRRITANHQTTALQVLPSDSPVTRSGDAHVVDTQYERERNKDQQPD